MAAQRAIAQGSKVPGRKESGGEIEGSRTKGVWFPRNALLALQGEFGADFVLSCVTGWTATVRFVTLPGITSKTFRTLSLRAST